MAQRWPREVIRASLAFYFLVTDIAAFVLYAWAGLVEWDTIASIGILLPGLVVGFGLANLTAQRMNEQLFRYVATGVIIISSLVTLGREGVRMRQRARLTVSVARRAWPFPRPVMERLADGLATAGLPRD